MSIGTTYSASHSVLRTNPLLLEQGYPPITQIGWKSRAGGIFRSADRVVALAILVAIYLAALALPVVWGADQTNYEQVTSSAADLVPSALCPSSEVPREESRP